MLTKEKYENAVKSSQRINVRLALIYVLLILFFITLIQMM